MTFAAIVQLLQTALLLLTMAQAPNVPPALKTQAVNIANQAIVAATQALGSAKPATGGTTIAPTLPTTVVPTAPTIPSVPTTPAVIPPQSYREVVASQVFGPIGTYASQYSQWVMHEAGWGNYLMYYCKNTDVNGVYRDRIWRAENWGDGKTGWVNDQIVLEASSESSEEDLACSPTVAISGSTWHMYYVTAKRAKPGELYLYHAIAVSPWTTWTNREPVKGISQPFSGYMDTPSAVSEYGRITLYYVGADYGLYRMTSVDGVTFTSPTKTDAPTASHGRVTRSAGGVYYYVYSRNAGNLYGEPNTVYLSTSTDGQRFSAPQQLFASSGSGWDGSRAWSPHSIMDTDGLRVYYAGNTGSYNWWGSNSALGVRIFRQ